MDTNVLIKTAYGDVSLETLIQVYESRLKHREKHEEYWKKYYQEKKAELSAKRRAAYARKHQKQISKTKRKKPLLQKKIVSEPVYSFTKEIGLFCVSFK